MFPIILIVMVQFIFLLIVVDMSQYISIVVLINITFSIRVMVARTTILLAPVQVFSASTRPFRACKAMTYICITFATTFVFVAGVLQQFQFAKG